jgi:hypothetical protein
MSMCINKMDQQKRSGRKFRTAKITKVVEILIFLPNIMKVKYMKLKIFFSFHIHLMSQFYFIVL